VPFATVFSSFLVMFFVSVAPPMFVGIRAVHDDHVRGATGLAHLTPCRERTGEDRERKRDEPDRRGAESVYQGGLQRRA
jgi:hypothetical protein